MHNGIEEGGRESNGTQSFINIGLLMPRSFLLTSARTDVYTVPAKRTTAYTQSTEVHNP